MPNRCTVCDHEQRADIDGDLVRGEGSTRDIAGRFGASKSAVDRHKQDHLPVLLAKATEAATIANADDLLAEVERLRGETMGILETAKGAKDLRTALAAIREARESLTLVAKLLGELKEGPTVNVTISTAWVEVRSVLVAALAPYPEARAVVAEELARLEVGRVDRD